MKQIILAVGARPNFIKASPLFDTLNKNKFAVPILVHTGQHYDYEMSQAFFADLKLPEPSFNLEVGSGSHAEQTAKIMVRFEKVIEETNPDLVVVFGDVNSTIACSLTARKKCIPVAHVEAGLRSFDESMPEEINRKLTDCISDLLFTHCQDADDNLRNEGIVHVKSWDSLRSSGRSFLDTPLCVNVGNIMIDSLKKTLSKIDANFEKNFLKKFQITDKDETSKVRPFGLITIHRPSNVDCTEKLFRILSGLNDISKKMKLIFPVHPRTKEKIDDLASSFFPLKDFVLIKPLNYEEFVILEKNAFCVITDSGGIQEETSYLQVPCYTLRPNTERPVTIKKGTNKIVSIETIDDEITTLLDGKDPKAEKSIPLWDGKTSERITVLLNRYLYR